MRSTQRSTTNLDKMNGSTEDSLEKLTNLIEAEANACPTEENPPAAPTPSLMFKKRTNNIMSLMKRQNIPFPSNPFTNLKDLKSPSIQSSTPFAEEKEKLMTETVSTENTYNDFEREESKQPAPSEEPSMQSTSPSRIQHEAPVETLTSTLSAIKSDFNVLERLLHTEEQFLASKDEEIQSLRQITHEQNTALNEIIVEVDETHTIINQQLEMIQSQQHSIQTLNKIKAEVQIQLKNIDAVIEENEKYISSTNEKVCSVVDECQKWKNSVTEVKKELEASEESKRLLQKSLESTLESRKADFETIQSSHKREKEILSKENCNLKEQNESLTASLESLSKITRDLQQKWNRIRDNFKVDYSNIVKGEEEDLIKIYSLVESHLQQERLAFRMKIKSISENLEQLSSALAIKEHENAKLNEKIESFRTEEGKENEKYFNLLSRHQELESSYNKAVQSLESRLKESEQDSSNQINLNTNLQSQIQNLQSELSTLKSNAQSLEDTQALKNEIETLKKELDKKSAGIAECIKIKNTEIDNLKRHYEQIISEKELQLLKAMENNSNIHTVNEIIQDMSKEFNNNKAFLHCSTPSSKRSSTTSGESTSKGFERKAKRTASRIITSGGASLRKKDLDFDLHPQSANSIASSCTTATLAHYAQRSSSSQRKLLNGGMGGSSDDNFV